MPLNLLRVASGPSTTISAEEIISQKLSGADPLQEVYHLVPVVTMIATSLGGDDHNGRSTTYIALFRIVVPVASMLNVHALYGTVTY